MTKTSYQVYDTDIHGDVDSTGKVVQHYGVDAVKNSIINWLTSFDTDFIRGSGRAGYVTKHLYKPMSEENKENLARAIIDGFAQDYTPSATITSLEIESDYENHLWIIYLKVYIPKIKDEVEVETVIKNFI